MDMNLANKLTMLRVVMIPVFLLVLFLAPEPMNRYIAVIIFIVASLTDMLDGKIARKYNLVSNFGKFMDPLADKLLVMSALVSMVALKDLAAWVVIVILAREFTITGFRTLAMEANIVMAASWWGKVKTTVQMIMIPVVLLNLPFDFMVVVEPASIPRKQLPSYAAMSAFPTTALLWRRQNSAYFSSSWNSGSSRGISKLT